MIKKFSFSVLVVFIAVLLYLSFFNRFQTDDYILAWNLSHYGFWESIKDTYMTWSGRYFSFTLIKLTPLVFHYYDFYPTFSVITSVILLWIVFFGLLKNTFQNTLKDNIIKSTVLTGIYFLISVNISEHLYWNSGAKVYLYPFIYYLFLLNTILLNNKKPKIIYDVISYLLTFMIIGSNEIIAVILCSTLFMIQKRDRKYSYLLYFAIILLVFSFLAPGNFVRMNNKDKISWIRKIGVSGFVFGGTFLISLLKSLFIVPLFNLFFKNELSYLNTKNLKIKIFYLAIIGITTIALLGVTTPRINDSFLIFFFVSVCLFLNNKINEKKYVWLSLIVIFLPTIPLPSYKNYFSEVNYNFNDALTDVIHFKNLKGFKNQIKKREIQLETNKQDIIYLTPIKNAPKTLYFNEIGNEKNRNFINNQLEKFYGKKAILLNVE